MKINKILAAGIAATLAVTSLAAVASAETVSQTFDMAKTIGTEKMTFTLAKFTDNTDITTITSGNIHLRGIGTWEMDSAQLKITGTRNGGTNTVSESYNFLYGQEFEFVTGAVNQAGQANISSWDAVTSAEIIVTVKRVITSQSAQFAGLWCDVPSDKNPIVNMYFGGGAWAEATAGTKGYQNAAGDGAEGLYYYLGTSVNPSWISSTVETKDLYAFLEKTTDGTTIYRQDVKPLSIAGI